MIDSCTYIYIYIQVSVRDITLVFANKFCNKLKISRVDGGYMLE